MAPRFHPYDPTTLDACNDVIDLIDQFLVAGNARKPVDWKPEELKEPREWCEAQIDG